MKPKCPLCSSEMNSGTHRSVSISVIAFAAIAAAAGIAVLVAGWLAGALAAGVFLIVAAASGAFSDKPILKCPNCGRQERILA